MTPSRLVRTAAVKEPECIKIEIKRNAFANMRAEEFISVKESLYPLLESLLVSRPSRMRPRVSSGAIHFRMIDKQGSLGISLLPCLPSVITATHGITITNSRKEPRSCANGKGDSQTDRQTLKPQHGALAYSIILLGEQQEGNPLKTDQHVQPCTR